MTYNQVVNYYRGLSKAAKALDLERQTVHAWKYMERIPTRWQLKLAGLTGMKPDRAAREEAEILAAYMAGNG